MKNLRQDGTLCILGYYAVYTVLIIAVSLPLPAFVTVEGVDAYSEGGFIEWCQFLLLAGSLVTFMAGFYLVPRARGTFAILAALICLALVRENDAVLDRVIPIWGWEALAVVLAAVGTLVVLRERSSIMQGVATIVSGHSFSLLWCGFLAAVPFAQIMGRAELIEALLGNEYLRNYKTLVHESTELLGYLLIMIGSLESLRETIFRIGSMEQIHKSTPEEIHEGWLAPRSLGR